MCSTNKSCPGKFFPVIIFILLLQKIALKLIAFESEVSLECRSKDCRGGEDRERDGNRAKSQTIFNSK
jgi:hypothetical protein